MEAWLFTILRNNFYSHRRGRRREVEDIDGQYSRTLAMPPTQQGQLDFQDLRRALMQLPAEQREVLLLTTAQQLSYDEAARICGCAVGTVKSRVHRARATLGRLLAVAHLDQIGPDAITMSSLRSTE
jgi:RNA polymerase sigma-70 factor (ECF subfamily)